MIEPVDLFAIVLALAVVIGSVNHLWIKLPTGIGMLIGSLLVSLLVVASDHVLHLHVMRWFRGTLKAADLSHFFLDGVLALLLYAGSLHVDVAALGDPAAGDGERDHFDTHFRRRNVALVRRHRP